MCVVKVGKKRCFKVRDRQTEPEDREVGRQRQIVGKKESVQPEELKLLVVSCGKAELWAELSCFVTLSGRRSSFTRL